MGASYGFARATLSLLVFGMVSIWFGLSTPFWWELAPIGGLCLATGILLALPLLKRAHDPPAFPRNVQSFPSRGTVVVEREVMVRCRYCGSLNLEGTAKSDSCGARL